MPVNFSLYKITQEDDFDFHPEDYSRFKFGDDAIAKQYGTALANAFISAHLSDMTDPGQMVVISSPYSFIPTATFAMKNHFVYQINQWLSDRGFAVVQETKVHRSITYKQDYGELDAEERMLLISNDRFHIDREFLHGKTLVFLDDIRITGSHERMIMKMIGQYNLQNSIYLLYFAELANMEIHPNIENHLNYRSVRSIFDLEPIIRSGSFLINTRFVKYILNHEFSAFSIFMENQSREFIDLLYNMALGNNYHLIEAYAQNLAYIKHDIKTYNLKQLQNGN